VIKRAFLGRVITKAFKRPKSLEIKSLISLLLTHMKQLKHLFVDRKVLENAFKGEKFFTKRVQLGSRFLTTLRIVFCLQLIRDTNRRSRISRKCFKHAEMWKS